MEYGSEQLIVSWAAEDTMTMKDVLDRDHLLDVLTALLAILGHHSKFSDQKVFLTE